MESQTSQVESSTSKKRTFRSEVWEHFSQVEGGDLEEPKAKCNHCGQVYGCHSRKSGTSNMSRHLKTCKKYMPQIDGKQKKLPFIKEEGEGDSIMFSQSSARHFLAKMLIKDELPIRMVEWEGFRELLKHFQKSFHMPSRRTIVRDIEKIYKKEKNELKGYIKKSHQRMCLTTDLWTSNQNINYLVLTGHFIDGSWKLHKKILNFQPIENHRGETIANLLETCLAKWGIAKVLTITVDNASSNDVAITHLVRSLKHWKALVLDGEFLHVRCFAHVLNLIVTDGLKEHQAAISKVRKAVKYVKSSPGQLIQFRNCIDNLKITFKGNVSLDVPTRWNSMYLMLQNAEQYSRAFERLEDIDRNFKLEMEEIGGLTTQDWDNIREFCKFLKVFYDTTIKVSASLHVTANVYIIEVCEVKMTIQRYADGENTLLKKMAQGMLNKLDKYWGSFDKINHLFFIAVLLDPRCKMKMVKHCLTILLGSDQATEYMKEIESLMERLYSEYKGNDAPNCTIVEQIPQTSTLVFSTFFDNSLDYDALVNMSEIEEYLGEKIEKFSDTLDILTWWKLKEGRFPILSKIAKDVLIIPISTVALESAFSCGGRIVDASRTSLLPKTVEAIICSQSWLRSKPPTMSEPIEDFKTIDEEIAANIDENDEGDDDFPCIVLS